MFHLSLHRRENFECLTLNFESKITLLDKTSRKGSACVPSRRTNVLKLSLTRRSAVRGRTCATFDNSEESF